MTGRALTDTGRSAPDPTSWDRSIGEPGASAMLDVRMGIRTPSRPGRPGPGDARSCLPSDLRRLLGVGAHVGWAGLRVVWRVGLAPMSLQRRTPWARSSTLTRTGHVYSARRLAELRIERARRRTAVAAAEARDGHRCIAADLVVDVACDGPLDGHEPPSRARGGDPLNPDHIVTLCAQHHGWCHSHPYEARQLGLLKRAEPRR